MEGHLRGIIGQLTVEEIVKEPEMVADRMRSTCADDMNKMGLEVVSFTIKEVRDKNDYIVNMGRPDIARIKRDADVAAAEAERDTAIKRAEAMRESAVAKAQADQERVLAETLSQAKQAEAQRDLEIKKANYLETVKKQQAQADKAYEIQTNVMQQQVVAEAVRVQQIEREQQIKVQEAEILRREKELIATVLKPAGDRAPADRDARRGREERLSIEAEGRAAATRAQGEAEAEIIFKKGEAEARAMNVKAEAFQEYNQAAVVDKLLTRLPEIVRALAAPLAKVDKITIVSTGNGGSTGMHKITGDMTEIAAQVPALFEALSGMQMSELLSKVRKIGDKRREPPTPAANGVSREAGRTRRPMAVLERVATLVRANLNDLIDRAEDPEKMIKQVILDMENQLLQVKTQVAISMADQHLLQKKQTEQEDKAAEWMRKAELAVDKEQDDLARAALERYQSFTQAGRGLHAAGRGPEAAGRHAAEGARAARSEARRGAGEERHAARAAPPRPRAREGQRRAARRWPAARPVAGFDRMRAQGAAQRSRQPGEIRAGGRRCRSAVRRAEEGR